MYQHIAKEGYKNVTHFRKLPFFQWEGQRHEWFPCGVEHWSSGLCATGHRCREGRGAWLCRRSKGSLCQLIFEMCSLLGQAKRGSSGCQDIWSKFHNHLTLQPHKKNVFPKIMHAKNQKAKSAMFFEGSSITSLNKILMSHSLLFIIFSLIQKE